MCLVPAFLGEIIGVVTKLALEDEMNRLCVFAGIAELIALATKRLALRKIKLWKLE